MMVVDQRLPPDPASSEVVGPSRLANTLTGHSNTLYSIKPAFTADDACVMMGSEDGRVCVWDVMTSDPVASMGGAGQPRAHARTVSCVAPHPSRTEVATFLTSSFDNSIKLWVGRAEGEGDGGM